MRGEIYIRRRGGFTLIELLVVIAIIGVLIAMLLPAIQKVRETASRMKCQNNLKQMALACYSFENTYQRYPMGVDNLTITPFGSACTWMWDILPFVEQQNLYNTFYYTYILNHLTTIPLYYCPSDPRPYSGDFLAKGCTDYVAVSGLDYADGLGIITASFDSAYFSVRVTDVTDGTSNTVMLGERPVSAGWGFGRSFVSDFISNMSGAAIGCEPSNSGILAFTYNQQGQPCPAPPRYFGGGPFNVNDTCSFDQIWSNHIGGANFAMGDGSVCFISYSAGIAMTSYTYTDPWDAPPIPLTIMGVLATRANGEVVEVP